MVVLRNLNQRPEQPRIRYAWQIPPIIPEGARDRNGALIPRSHYATGTVLRTLSPRWEQGQLASYDGDISSL